MLHKNPFVNPYLGQGPWMESPADIVAVLDSDIASVSDSMDSPDPANVLQAQRGRFTPAVLLHAYDL